MKIKLSLELVAIILFTLVILFVVFYSQKVCSPFLNDLYSENYEIKVIEKNISFQNIDELFCNGSVVEHNKGNSLVISVNKKIYFVLSQCLTFIFALLFIFIFRFSKLKYFLFIFVLSLGFQILFNFNFGLNIFNQVFLNNLLFLYVLRLFFDEV